MSPMEIVTAIKDGTVGANSGLEAYIATITGEIEKVAGTEGLDTTNDILRDIYGSLSEAVTGFAASGAGKAALGVAGAAASLGAEFYMHKKVMDVLNAGGSAAKAGSGALKAGSGMLAKAANIGGKLVKVGGGIVGGLMIAKDGVDAASSLLSGESMKGEDIGGIVGGVTGGLVGLLGGPAGVAIGMSIGNAAGEWVGGWFDDDVSPHEAANKLHDKQAKEWQKDNINKTPQYENLTREQQKQYDAMKARQREAMAMHPKITDTTQQAALNEQITDSGVVKELKKTQEALLAATTMTDNDPLMEQTLLQREQVEELKKLNNTTEKGVNQSKEQADKLEGGFKQAQTLASKYSKAAETWKEDWTAVSGSAAAQYTA